MTKRFEELKFDKMLLDTSLMGHSATMSIVELVNHHVHRLEMELFEFFNASEYFKREKTMTEKGNRREMADEFGDILMHCVSLSQYVGLDLDLLHSRASIKMTRGLKYYQDIMRKYNYCLSMLDFRQKEKRLDVAKTLDLLIKKIFEMGIECGYTKVQMLKMYDNSFEKVKKRIAKNLDTVKEMD